MGARRQGDRGGREVRRGYLSVERGGVGESGWEGRRQLRRVQRVRGPHVWAAGIESGHCELICGKKKTGRGVRPLHGCDTGEGGGGGLLRVNPGAQR